MVLTLLKPIQAALIAGLVCGALAQGVEPNRAPRRPVARTNFLSSPPNVIAPTRGGSQFWGDLIFAGNWRIQRNVVTGHYRLLDPDNVRRAWGNLEACQQRLDTFRAQNKIEPLSDTVVVLLHGLAGSRAQMEPLVRYIEGHTNWSVINVTYPSTRAAVADHAAALRSILGNLNDVRTIHFVAHSMGNLVIRHYLADHAADHQGRNDPRIGRIVMLGPPNHGSRLAQALGGNVIFDTTLGLSAQQLAHRWDELEPRLALPSCEYGIIAGGRGNDSGFNPLLPGDDDGTVRIAETRLAGASDFSRVDALHSVLMSQAAVQEQTLRYLRTGSFHADGVRHPITREDVTAELPAG